MTHRLNKITCSVVETQSARGPHPCELTSLSEAHTDNGESRLSNRTRVDEGELVLQNGSKRATIPK